VTHCTDEDLTLYYYGEGRRRAAIERHLEGCAACAALYGEIAGTLAMINATDAPERSDQYGLEVWQRIRHQLPERDERGLARFGGLLDFRFPRFAAAAGLAVLLVAVFLAGRAWRQPGAAPASANLGNPTSPTNPASPANPANPQSDVRDRILLASVADHLDRSERVLTDIMNVAARSNISTEQRWAEDLLQTSRLYRQDAIEADEPSVAAVLDDLERNLLEIVHSPSRISAADLEQLRRRIDAAALLFKVRVMSDELRQREQPPAGHALPQTSTRKIS
jgi:hypothetical protein